MYKTVKHIGEGYFVCVTEEGEEIKAGPNLSGMIRYTYFEDFSLPPIGWEVTREKLTEDYLPKAQHDFVNGKFKYDYTDEDGNRHYKDH